MATNNTFSVKNGLTIGNTTVIAANGVWVGANTNIIGPQGPQGVQGTIGVQGATGAQGTIGAQGDVGAQGAIGAQGSAGAQGFTGAQGATGPQGVQGFNGTQGAQGDVGAQGPTGPTGPQGPTGAPGAQGVQGQTGSPGAQGVQGFNGTQGAQGVQGAVGAQGPQGVQGFNGTQGATGPTGPQGVQGASGTATPYEQITANTNAIGNTQYLADTSGGPFNLTLPASPNFGSTIIITDGIGDFSTNNLTILRNGSTIANIADDVALNLSNSVSTLVYTGTTWQFITTAGTIGAQGVQGATGPQGSQGLAGAQGVLGAQGVQGVQGAQGATGAQGVQGSTGPQGSQGAQGITGTIAPYQQITANTNAIGNTQYLADTSGGSFNLTLPASPNFGSTILIADGTGSFSTNNLTVLNNGSTIANQNADLLLNLSNTVSTLVYTGTTWQFITTAGTVGAQGAQGVQGATGAQGVQGVLGAQGVQGVQGATGPQGSQGVTGPQGVQGATPAIGGSNTQVQFNNSGSLGGSSGLTWDGSFLTTSSIKNSALTSGRVTYAGASGLLSDSANLTYNGTGLGIGGVSANVKLDILNSNATYSLSQKVFNASAGTFFLGQSPSATFLSVDNFAMAFCTNSDGGVAGTSVPTNERMRITSAGDVGIGTSSPATKLHVNTTSGGVQVRATSDSDVSFSAVATAVDSTAFLTVINDARQWTMRVNGAESDQFQLRDSTAAANRLVIDSSGLVGIGTSSPATRLQLGDGSSGQLKFRIHRGAGTDYSEYFSDTGSTIVDTVGGGSFILRFGGTEKMQVTAAGNVGIGTSSPATKLNIENAGECQLQMAYSSTIFGRVGRLSSGNYEFSAYENGANLLFGTTTTNGSTTERMRIDSSGNVGIGTTSPDNNAGYTALTISNTTGGQTYWKSTGSSVTAYAGADSNGGYLATYTSHPLIFRTNNTERLRIPADAAGITFPATAVPSADANTLDDYEEGTWTPVFTAGTTAPTGVAYGTQVARYTKIGKSVTVWGVVALTSKGTGGSGEIRITGLPFTSENVSGLFPRGAGDVSDATWTASRTQITFATVPNDTYIAMIESGSGQSLSNPTWANQNNNSSYAFTITYPTST